MEGKNPYNFPRPAGLEEHILRNVADTAYIIADTKRDTYYCTRCGATGKLSEDYLYHGHNAKCYCGGCGDKAVMRYARYGRKSITETGRILWFRKHGAGTFCQLDEYDIDYTGDRPKVSLWPSAQYYFSKSKRVYYKHRPPCYRHGDTWEERKEISLPSPPSSYWFGVNNRTYEKTVSYPHPEDHVGSDLKYANFDMVRFGYDDIEDPYAIIRYMYCFLRWQSIELLEKAGFDGIVERRLRCGCKEINWRATELRKILKLNSAEIRDLRECYPWGGEQMDALIDYKTLRKKAPSTTIRNLNTRGLIIGNIGRHDWKKIEKYMTVETAIKYLERQQEQEMCRLSDYEDYLKECKTLGYDMKRKSVLFPGKLMEAHRNTSKAVQIEESKAMQEAFAEAVKELYPFDTYTNGYYLIRVAASVMELNEESKVLNHCVRTYADRVCRKGCIILFIRKVSDPDTPLFTVELSPERKIRQCRGLMNRSYPEDVAEFLESWRKDVLENKKAARKVA